jgi:GT2 family glycosyltransferase
MLSTIILNWNREYLLRQCVESYLDTVGGAFQLIVVDNASTDQSRAYLGALRDSGAAQILLLDNNLGGEAFNLAIPFASGNLIHLCENDQLFLPGWRNHVEAAFACFPDLGQLSLFADTPTDEEAWLPKESHLRFSQGKILYEAHGCVGTSSVIRARLFRDAGIRLRNIEEGKFKFPDDTSLSWDIKAAGSWCAWSDRYYVRNVGHETAEYARNPEYYKSNYASKPWLGTAGWARMVEEWRATPKPARESLAFPGRPLVPEKTPAAPNEKRGRLWSMFDSRTAESEALDFLLALTRLIKPEAVLETGTWLGLSACAIGKGLLANGFGRLTTLEADLEAHAAAVTNIREYGLHRAIEALLMPSLEFTPGGHYDMVVFGSEPALSVGEFRRFRPYLAQDATLVFLASGSGDAGHYGVHALVRDGAVAGIGFPTPRGLFVGRPTEAPPS